MTARRPRILLAERLDEIAERQLAAVAEIVRPVGPFPRALHEAVRECDALIARTHTPVPRDLLEAGARLRVVGIAGVGLDNVDVAAAQARGIRVVHVPDAASDAVAELAVLFMLELLRPTRRLSAAYARGEYRAARAAAHGRELRELTVGIIGLGRIGTRVGRICAQGFGARVVYNDIAPVDPPFAAEALSKEALYAAADIVSLHVPLTPDTRGMIDARALDRMRPGALLVNTARGKLVQTDALLAALRSGKLGGAGLDVTDPEPLPTDHPLFGFDNCLLTPHIASRTHGGLRRMCDVASRVLAALAEPT